MEKDAHSRALPCFQRLLSPAVSQTAILQGLSSALVQEKGKADLKCSFLFSGEWEWQGGRGKEGLVLVTMALMKV